MDEKTAAPENKDKRGGRTGVEYIYCEATEWLETFALALTLMVVLFLFVFKYVSVDGSSMNNTLMDKDNLIISAIGNDYEYGDIIVVWDHTHSQPLIKRVIATEGQTVDIDFETWTVTVDGVALDEPYIKRVNAQMRGEGGYEYPITIEPGKVFVMGDNRNGSDDSRNPTIGQLDVRRILGKVVFRVYPFDKIGTVQ